jgi:hypothetical protein
MESEDFTVGIHEMTHEVRIRIEIMRVARATSSLSSMQRSQTTSAMSVKHKKFKLDKFYTSFDLAKKDIEKILVKVKEWNP